MSRRLLHRVDCCIVHFVLYTHANQEYQMKNVRISMKILWIFHAVPFSTFPPMSNSTNRQCFAIDGLSLFFSFSTFFVGINVHTIYSVFEMNSSLPSVWSCDKLWIIWKKYFTIWIKHIDKCAQRKWGKWKNKSNKREIGKTDGGEQHWTK